jgi:DtxR family Mn-dependent transcriptional regulator
MSISVENFVKTIYTQIQVEGGDTKPGTIARLLNITNAAATDMARKLSDKKLINYIKYKQLTLTDEGRAYALKIIRRHRLWETFLYKTLHLSLHEIHQEAEMLEHLTSDFLVEKIDDFLGKPSVDPHGDPIPTKHGVVLNDKEQFLLKDSEEGVTYIISRLFNSDKNILDFCTENKITKGNEIIVSKQYPSSGMTEILIEGAKIMLNHEFSSTIYVKPA